LYYSQPTIPGLNAGSHEKDFGLPKKAMQKAEKSANFFKKVLQPGAKTGQNSDSTIFWKLCIITLI